MKDPLDGNYMLVMYKLDTNLKEYLQQNHNKLTWEKRIQIVNMLFLEFIEKMRFTEICILEMYYLMEIYV